MVIEDSSYWIDIALNFPYFMNERSIYVNGRTEMDRESKVLSFIEAYIAERGYPPSLREICEGCGISSKSSARLVLKRLEEAGYLKVSPKEARGIKLIRPLSGIPLVGRIPAGEPLIDYGDGVEEVIPVDPEFFGGDRLVAVRVRGDSMKNAGILPGDIAIVKPVEGDISVYNRKIVAAAVYESEPYITLKRLEVNEKGITLVPESEGYHPMFFSWEDLKQGRIRIIGVLKGIVRRE